MNVLLRNTLVVNTNVENKDLQRTTVHNNKQFGLHFHSNYPNDWCWVWVVWGWLLVVWVVKLGGRGHWGALRNGNVAIFRLASIHDVEERGEREDFLPDKSFRDGPGKKPVLATERMSRKCNSFVYENKEFRNKKYRDAG